VWSYIVKNDLEYHEIYDKQAELFGSISHPDNRLVTLYDREFESYGSLSISQFIYPSETNRLKSIESDYYA